MDEQLEKNLDDLRARIDEIDARLVGELNERAKISRAIGQLKIAGNSSVFCPDREAALLEKISGLSSGALPSEHLTAIYQEILSSSRCLQQQMREASLGPEGGFSHLAGQECFGSKTDSIPSNDLSEFRVSPSMPPAEHVYILGNRGLMGSMLTARLQSAGYLVKGSDVGEQTSLAASSLVLVCVPPADLHSTLQKLAAHLYPEQLLMDITSVKTLPMRWREEVHRGPVIGSHPLFGPNPKSSDLRVALVAGKMATQTARNMAEKLFTSLGCQVFWTTSQEHDQQTGLAQSLNFGINAAFFSLLAQNNLRSEFMTPSCRRLLEAARKLLNEDRKMFLEFTALNPEFPSILEQFRGSLNLENAGEFERIARMAAEYYLKLNQRIQKCA